MLWTSLTGAALAGAMVVLIVRYMRTPRVRDIEISALRFLPELSPAQRERVQLRISVPLTSPLFWVRFFCLVALLATLLVDRHSFRTSLDAHLGLRIVIDRSPSMTLGQPSRLDLATAFAGKLQQDTLAKGGCAEMAWIPALTANVTKAAEPTAKDGIPLAQLIAAFRQPDRDALQERTSCAITHIAMISDLPRPDEQLLTAEDENAPQYLWFQVGQAEANTALRMAEFSSLVTGNGNGVLTIVIDQYGSAQTRPELTVMGPDGQPLLPLEPVNLSLRGTKRIGFPVTMAGTYLAELRETGGLSLDNRLRIDLKTLSSLKIAYSSPQNDPQLRSLLLRLGSIVLPDEKPDLTIASYSRSPEGTTASGIYFVEPSPAAQDLGYFDSNSQLLELVDLDLLEAMSPGGLVAPPPDFQRIASATGGGAAVWIAVRGGAAPAVLLPAHPTASDGGEQDAEVSKAWWVLFLNAFRYVTESRLADVETGFVDPAGLSLSNVMSESNTSQIEGTNDNINSIQPTIGSVLQERLWWPWLACVATILMLVERIVGLGKS